jgi:hypothetical protein
MNKGGFVHFLARKCRWGRCRAGFVPRKRSFFHALLAMLPMRLPRGLSTGEG